ncbi:SCO4225 family membrane protein [Streptomyces sp. NPDC001212]
MPVVPTAHAGVARQVDPGRSAAVLALVRADDGGTGIWPLMTTAPLSIVALLVAAPAEWASSLDWLSPLIFTAGATLSGLFNAALLGLLTRRLRAQDAHPTA